MIEWKEIDNNELTDEPVLLCLEGDEFSVCVGEILEDGSFVIENECYNKWAFSHWSPLPVAFGC